MKRARRKKLRTLRVWHVEMFGVRNRRGDEWWSPTVGTALTRDIARIVLAEWQTRNPDDRFRLRAYERIER